MAEAGNRDRVGGKWSTRIVIFPGESVSRIPKREHLSLRAQEPRVAASYAGAEWILEVTPTTPHFNPRLYGSQPEGVDGVSDILIAHWCLLPSYTVGLLL